MAIKIMDSFEPAGSGFKVVNAKDIAVTENVNHDLEYALKIIGYLLGLNTDTTDLDGYLEKHRENSAKSVADISLDILSLLRQIVGNDSAERDIDLSGKTLNDLKNDLTTVDGEINYSGKRYIRLTKNFGKYIVGGNGYVDVEIEDGQNITDVILNAFREVLRPTVTLPSITVEQDMANLNFEIGSTYRPILKIEFNPGVYLYGPITGVKFNEYSYSFNGKSVEPKKITLNNDVIEILDPIPLTTPGNGVYKFTNISADYSGSENDANNNIGVTYEDADGKISITGNIISGVSTLGVNVYVPYYVSYSAENIASNSILLNGGVYYIDNDTKKDLMPDENTNSGKTLPGEITTDMMKSMLVAIPIDSYDSRKTLKIYNKSNNAILQSPVISAATIYIYGANNYGSDTGDDKNYVKYKIFYVNNAGADSGENTYVIKYE